MKTSASSSIFWDSRAGACLSVVVPNTAVLGLINMMDLKIWLELGLLILTLAYTIWRWRRDSFVICDGCRNGRIPDVCPLPPEDRPWYCPKRIRDD